MRKIARVDANQSEIVKALRKAGCSVFITSQLGGGFPDIVCSLRGVNYLFEIKDPNQPPSKQKLTTDEEIFFKTWQGQVHVIKTIDEALKILKLA